MPRECSVCAVNLYDHVAIYVNPSDYAWELVDGGGGNLHDPVDSAQGLRSLWSTAGGTGSRTVTFSGNGASQHLTVMLDTATGTSADTAKATWGTIANIKVVPFIGASAQPALSLAWTRSPLDPSGTSLFVDANGADLGLAVRSFGASPSASQAESIWGAGATLAGRDAVGRAYTSYRLTFDYDVSSHDTRLSQASLARPPADVSVALAVVAAMLFARRATVRA